MIEKLLWVTGILAAIAILIRGSVALGMYMGILPGIILAVAPTIFVYLVGFAIVRRLLPFAPGMAANGAAAVIVLALGVAIVAPMAFTGRAAFAAAVKSNVTPAQPVKIAGHVRLERHGRGNSASAQSKEPPPCDDLCAALLETPGVLSVTLAGSDFDGKPIASVTYRLAPKSEAPGPGLAPKDPSGITAHLPPRKHEGKRRDWDAEIAGRNALANSVKARWALRLATEQTLVAEPARSSADMTIAITDLIRKGPVRLAVTETEIRDAGGTPLLRHQRISAQPVANIFFIQPEGDMVEKFGIGRVNLYTGGRYEEFKPIETLFAETNLARPVLESGGVDRMRGRIAAAASGSAPRADLSMVAPWLATIDWSKPDEADIDLLATLLADTSIGGLDKIYDGYERHVAPRLRRSIIVRLLDPGTTGELRNRLNTLVRSMPDGTFATLLPEEDALLRNPELRLQSSALVMRLADRGASAVPLLMALLREDARVESWWKRRWMMEDIRRAFSLLGRDAAPALPLIEQFFAMKSNPLVGDWKDAQSWRVAMVRMGHPVETLPFPPGSRPEQVAKDRANIAAQAARPADPKRD